MATPGYSSSHYDWPSHGDPRTICVLASTYRSGSTLLSTAMWQTGRLGAPWEYFNYEREMDFMKFRLGADESGKYISELKRCRTSPNGVFSIKAHYHHFANMLNGCAEARALARDAKYIHIERRDKIAQSVSLARALQSNSWLSFESGRPAPLFYSFDFIKACLEELRHQSDSWWRWFNDQGITPMVVVYEDFMLDPDGTLEAIERYVGVDRDAAHRISVPRVERQSDGLNAEWAQRFGEALASEHEVVGF